MQMDRLAAGARHVLRQLASGPQSLMFLPALALAAFWFGGEAALMPVAMGIPLLVWLASDSPAGRRATPAYADAMPDLDELSDALLGSARRAGLTAGCLIYGLQGAGHDGPGRAAQARRATLLQHLRDGLRPGDVALWRADGTLAVLPQPNRSTDLDALLVLARRLQARLQEVDVMGDDGAVCCGLALSSRLPPVALGADLVKAASRALGEARLAGGSGLRVAGARLPGPAIVPPRNIATPDEVLQALHRGHIQPWFQPQLSTETGRLSGVEALARWLHPARGLVAPAAFLPALASAGATARLGAEMLERGCATLAGFDAAGTTLPAVALNLAPDELHAADLPDRVRAALDRHGLSPHRLRFEITGATLLDSDPVAVGILHQLADLGCGIDLSGFGGPGSFAMNMLRRLPVHRLKIDRSLIARIDRDEGQRRLVAGALALADRLGLETLAEGVESHAEHAMLAQLGCGHVQGFGIGRPMPADLLADWMRRLEGRLAQLPSLTQAVLTPRAGPDTGA